MGLLAGIVVILTLGYGTVYAFQYWAEFFESLNTDCLYSSASASYTSLGVGFRRGADTAKIKKKGRSSMDCKNQFSSPMKHYEPISAVRSPTVRSVV